MIYMFLAILPTFCFLWGFSCLAGESMHFYNEVQQLEKIPVNDPVKRIYMVRHIIEKYVSAGITLEPVTTNILIKSTLGSRRDWLLDRMYNKTFRSIFHVRWTSKVAWIIYIHFGNSCILSRFQKKKFGKFYLIDLHTGAPMEVNISHRTRQEILTTLDLAHSDLFKNAVNELLQLINMVSSLPFDIENRIPLQSLKLLANC